MNKDTAKQTEASCNMVSRELTIKENLHKRQADLIREAARLGECIQELERNPYLEEKLTMFRHIL